MYAVIFCGGKQHKVKEGERISVELLPAEAGSEVELDKVLLISDGTNIKVGAPRSQVNGTQESWRFRS